MYYIIQIEKYHSGNKGATKSMFWIRADQSFWQKMSTRDHCASSGKGQKPPLRL
jgi:hypothetical protein